MSLLELETTRVSRRSPSQFLVLTSVAFALTALSAAWGAFDPRTLDGVALWIKPFKFSVSFVVLFATIFLIERRLSDTARDGWTLRVTGWVMAAAFLSEMAYIFYQAARSEASHFNMSTPFHEFMYTVIMAGGAVSLVIGIAIVGWVAWRDKAANLSPALREAIWLGCLLSFLLTMIVAGYMSGTLGHFVGDHPAGAPTIPMVGWSGVVGDLRPAHFASLHAMQALPLIGIYLDWRGRGDVVGVVRVSTAVYAALTLGLFTQAILGFPLISMA